jgi:PiT family inorganic phosphate transporter
VTEAGAKTTTWIPFILLGTVPLAYALNRAMPGDQMTQFVAVAEVAQQSLEKSATAATPADPRKTLSVYVRTQEFKPDVMSALAAVTGSIGAQVKEHGSLKRVPAEAVANVRNDMYLASEAIRLLQKNSAGNLGAGTKANLKAFKKQIDDATQFIPLWVKIAIAIGLGLGTMVGWKRIVVTVGERIRKTHLL